MTPPTPWSDHVAGYSPTGQAPKGSTITITVGLTVTFP
jgi:hypothetical protein